MTRLQLEVYQTDAEVYEAAADAAGERLRAAVAARGRAAAALAGGRSGRGVMVALAAQGALPWERIDWWLTDERCVTPTDPLSNGRLARESLFGPRGVAAERIHLPPLGGGSPARMAQEYGRLLVGALGDPPRFDVVVLGLGLDGGVAALMPGSHALVADGGMAAVELAEVTTEPRVARITITPSILRAARAVLVTAAGPEFAGTVAAVLQPPAGAAPAPAALVPPSETASWIIDRAAAAVLLRHARPAEH